MTDLRKASPGLMSALYTLADANPDVAAVEALTAETLRKRAEPYDVKSSTRHLTSSGGQVQNGLAECVICGATMARGTETWHVTFHNAVETRLRTLEGK